MVYLGNRLATDSERRDRRESGRGCRLSKETDSRVGGASSGFSERESSSENSRNAASRRGSRGKDGMKLKFQNVLPG